MSKIKNSTAKIGVEMTNLVKTFGDFNAVDNLSINVKPGELFTLVGPSGCGKTTLLRMIAGFNKVDGGEIRFNDKLMNNVPAHKRNIGMVFQNYAVFPHMTVAENVAYGLKARHESKENIAIRIQEAMETVQISEYRDRLPSQLSGGQQQRVALARAIVIRPDILLMDEPLSNLDAKLRVDMRVAIKRMQQDLGITTIYVTHDQEEALAISDNIAVMKDGIVKQAGTPEEIYGKPENSFIADFIGTSNFLYGSVKSSDSNGETVLSLGDAGEIIVPLKKQYSDDIIASIRPRDIKLSPPSIGAIKGRVIVANYLGDCLNYIISYGKNSEIEVKDYDYYDNVRYNTGDEVGISFDIRRINIFSEDGEEALIK